jgi:hypothetical protein
MPAAAIIAAAFYFANRMCATALCHCGVLSGTTGSNLRHPMPVTLASIRAAPINWPIEN